MSSWHYEFGRQRAYRERVPVLEIVETLEGIVEREDVYRDDHVKTAEAAYRGVPKRYQDEIDGMIDGLPITRSSALLYMFRTSDVVEEAIGEDNEDGGEVDDHDEGGHDAGPAGEGCTIAIVAPEASAVDAPLLLKVRDVKAKGLQPQTIVERPATDDHHGFVSLSTSMTPAVFQGVNDHGLAAANSFVDLADEDLEESEYLRNGILIRRILEECASVDEATELAENVPVERSKGLNLFVVDEDEAATLELDPDAAERRLYDDSILVRANHYPSREAAIYPSSEKRYERACEIVDEVGDPVSIDDLEGFARDHRNGPGPDSICRHSSATPDTVEAQSESTTVSMSVFIGGETSFRGTFGNACKNDILDVKYGADRFEDLASGVRWRATVGSEWLPILDPED